MRFGQSCGFHELRRLSRYLCYQLSLILPILHVSGYYIYIHNYRQLSHSPHVHYGIRLILFPVCVCVCVVGGLYLSDNDLYHCLTL